MKFIIHALFISSYSFSAVSDNPIPAIPADIAVQSIHTGLKAAAHAHPIVKKIYSVINDSPKGINVLAENDAIDLQARMFHAAIMADEKLSSYKKKLSENKNKILNLTFTLPLIEAATLFNKRYRKLLNRLLYNDKEGSLFKIYSRVEKTLKKNVDTLGDSCCMSVRQELCFKAALFALHGLNLQEQHDSNPAIFTMMWYHGKNE